LTLEFLKKNMVARGVGEIKDYYIKGCVVVGTGLDNIELEKDGFEANKGKGGCGRSRDRWGENNNEEVGVNREEGVL